jgi:hypothetical protein
VTEWEEEGKTNNGKELMEEMFWKGWREEEGKEGKRG